MNVTLILNLKARFACYEVLTNTATEVLLTYFWFLFSVTALVTALLLSTTRRKLQCAESNGLSVCTAPTRPLLTGVVAWVAVVLVILVDSAWLQTRANRTNQLIAPQRRCGSCAQSARASER